MEDTGTVCEGARSPTAGRPAGSSPTHLPPIAALPSLLVLGLPRGGVPVAWEVAAALHAPLDVFVVRKLGAPRWEELAVGRSRAAAW